MNNIEAKILDFDSKLFDFKVAKILTPKLTTLELQATLMELCGAGVHLVYWASDAKDEGSQEAAKKLQGFLCSRQITYVIDLQNLPTKIEMPEEVELYTDKDPNIDLETLAFYTGAFSHFKIDPKFPSHLFFKLYKTWIVNSTNGQLADAILVVRRKDQIAGMITIAMERKSGGSNATLNPNKFSGLAQVAPSNKGGVGSIGLFAVYPEYRGQNIGTHLMQAAQINFVRAHLTTAQIVTQGANKVGCGFLEKCGYEVGKVENFYHFWL